MIAVIRQAIIQVLSAAVALLIWRQAQALTLALVAMVGCALAVNYTTYQTRALYQQQQKQFALLQRLQNERSQLALEVGALASHARLEAWAKGAGFEVISEHEVLP